MSTRLQTDIVGALLKARGVIVKTEVPLGRGLWKGIRTDFLIECIDGYPKGLAVECKWQDRSGSASEKIAYTVLNIKRCYPVPAILLCSGDELMGPLEWAKTEVGGNLVAAFGTDEFIIWSGKIKPCED